MMTHSMYVEKVVTLGKGVIVWKNVWRHLWTPSLANIMFFFFFFFFFNTGAAATAATAACSILTVL